jgi:3-deoxy-manno-octulosonate cytidylyltransferase (CMP-KDO synthetase)
LFFRHQGIYGYTRDLLLRFVRWKTSPLERAESLEQLRALENGVRIQVVMTESGSPGVDTPEDAKAVAASLCEARDRGSNVGRGRVAHRATATGRRER